MKDLKAIRGSDLVREMVAEGEHERQDFKYAISDARKIARSISAFANNSGGRLLIGVKDNGTIAGVRNEEDVYVVELAASRYCRPSQPVTFKAYKVDGVQTVIVAEIGAAGIRPVEVREVGDSWRSYYRVADENITAHPLMVRSWQSGATVFDLSLSRVLSWIESAGAPVEVRAVACGLHIGLASAEDSIVALAATGLVRFVYADGRFLVAAAEKE